MEAPCELKYFGRMNDPTCSAHIKGPCGDEMEFYLLIRNGMVADVKFYTRGCLATQLCGSVGADMALGRTIQGVLKISPGDVIEKIEGIPQDHLHCSILAVSTLHKAIAYFFLEP